MRVSNFRTLWLAWPTLVVTLTSCLATFLTALVSAASPTDALVPMDVGGGGTPTLDTLAPSGNSPQGLANVNASTGAAETSFPFLLPSARGRAQPSLVLAYDSSHGVGFGGMGWTLNLPSIVRKGASGLPQFIDAIFSPGNLAANTTADDYYVDGQRLVPITTTSASSIDPLNGKPWPSFLAGATPRNTGWAYYRTEVDDGRRYFFDMNTWVVQLPDGTQLQFGQALDNNASFPGSTENTDSITQTGIDVLGLNQHNTIYRWNLVRQADPDGNTVYYVWDDEHQLISPTAKVSGTRFLTDIYDTQALNQPATPANFAHHVHLTWRPTAYPAGLPAGYVPASAPYANSPIWKAPPWAHLTQVDVTSAGWGTLQRSLVRQYQLYYRFNGTATRDYLSQIFPFGNCGGKIQENSSGLIASTSGCYHDNPTSYTYYGVQDAGNTVTPSPVGQILAKNKVFNVDPNVTSSPVLALADVDGDGAADLMTSSINATSKAVSSTIELRTQSGLVTKTGVTASPSWKGTLIGDWGTTGSVNALTVATNFKNNATPFSAVQFNAASSSWSQVGLPAAPAAQLGVLANVPASEFASGRSVDVDGDGLPDMTVLPLDSVGDYGSFFTARDRSGRVFPFLQPGQELAASPGADPANFGPQISFTTIVIVFGGALVDSGAFQLPDVYYQPIAVRAFADLDGDGVTDELLANKFLCSKCSASPLNQTGPDPASPFSNFVGLKALPGHGDGRFGIPDPSPGFSSPTASYDTGIQLAARRSDTSLGPQDYPVGPDVFGTLPSSLTAKSGIKGGALLRFGDLNGDGLSDYAILNSSGLFACIRTGVNWDEAFYQCAQDLSVSNQTNGALDPTKDIEIADIDGSGIGQVIYFDKTGATGYLLSPNGSVSVNGVANAPRDGLLQTISNGYGGSTTLSYQSVHGSAKGSVPRPVWVVTKDTTTNGLSGAAATFIEHDYGYSGPLYDPRDQAFVGFHAVSVTNPGGPGVPGSVVTTTYATQTCTDFNACNSGVLGYQWERASRGLPVIVETSDLATGKRFTTTVHQYTTPLFSGGLIDGTLSFMFTPDSDHTYLWDDSQQGTPSTVQAFVGLSATLPITLPTVGTELRRAFRYDSLGHRNASVDYGAVGTDTPMLETDTWDLPPSDVTGGWNYRVTQTLSGYSAAGAPWSFAGTPRERDYSYWQDGLPKETIGKLTGTLPLPGPTGIGSRAAPAPFDASKDGMVSLSFTYYDGLGNLTGATTNSLPGYCTQYTYDSLYGQFQTAEIAFTGGVVSGERGPLFQACAGTALTTESEYDRGLERITKRVTPDGATTTWTYDDLGRYWTINQPDAFNPGQSVQLALFQYAETNNLRRVGWWSVDPGTPDTAANDPTQQVGVLHLRYVDGLGEVRAAADLVGSRVSGARQFIISGVHQNVAGRVVANWEPSYAGVNPDTLPVGALPAEMTAPVAGNASISYDALGRVTSTTDINGFTSTRTYHTAQMSVDLRDPEQVSGTHTSAFNTLIQDGHGRPSIVYQNVTNAAQPGSIVTFYEYFDPTSQPTRIERLSSASDGGVRSFSYDSLGRMVQSQEPNSGTWTYAYNDRGELVGTADPRGCGQNISYDGVGRILGRDYSPCQPSSQPAYSAPDTDGFGHPTTGNGEEVFYQYDGQSLGHLSGVNDRARFTGYAYDGRGRVTDEATWIRALDWRGGQLSTTRHAQHFTWSQGNRLLTESTDAGSSLLSTNLGQSPTLTYDYTWDGRLESVASTFGWIITSTSYDASGRVTGQKFGDASKLSAVFGHDPGGRPNGFSLTRTAPRPWTNAAAYVLPAASDPYAVTMNATTLTNVTLQRDGVGNILGASDNASSVFWPATAKPTNGAVYKYFDDYRLASATNVTSSGKVPVDTWASPFAFEQGIPGNHNFPQMTSETTRWRSQTFKYDWAGNLTSSTDDRNDFYDRSLGNVVNGWENPALGSSQQNDQLTSATSSDGSKSLTPAYASDGSLSTLTLNPSGVKYQYFFDEVGELAFALRTDANGEIGNEYLYDSDGQRRVKGVYDFTTKNEPFDVVVNDMLMLRNAQFETTPADPQHASGGVDYEDDSQTDHIYMAGGVAHAFFDSGPTMPQGGRCSATGCVHVFLNFPGIGGSASLVTDYDSGEVVERSAFQPFGQTDIDYRPARWHGYREVFKYAGQLDDSEVGLVYMGARYYSPELGRFISPDPLVVHTASDRNPYEYANGNPLRFHDPSGLLGEDDIDGEDDLGDLDPTADVVDAVNPAALLQSQVSDAVPFDLPPSDGCTRNCSDEDYQKILDKLLQDQPQTGSGSTPPPPPPPRPIDVSTQPAPLDFEFHPFPQPPASPIDQMIQKGLPAAAANTSRFFQPAPPPIPTNPGGLFGGLSLERKAPGASYFQTTQDYDPAPLRPAQTEDKNYNKIPGIGILIPFSNLPSPLSSLGVKVPDYNLTPDKFPTLLVDWDLLHPPTSISVMGKDVSLPFHPYK